MVCFGLADHRYRQAGLHTVAAAVRICSARGAAAKVGSDVEQEMQHVAVLDDVVLAFGPHLARVFGALLAAVPDEVVKRDGLGADEAPLEIGVNHCSGLRRGRADMHGPSPHFLHPGGEISLQPKKFVGRANEAVQSGFFLSEVGEKRLFFFGIKPGEFALQLGADGHDWGVFLGRILAQPVQVGVVVEAILHHVADEHGRLGGDEA